MGLLPHGGLHPLPRVSRFSFCRHSLPRYAGSCARIPARRRDVSLLAICVRELASAPLALRRLLMRLNISPRREVESIADASREIDANGALSPPVRRVFHLWFGRIKESISGTRLCGRHVCVVLSSIHVVKQETGNAGCKIFIRAERRARTADLPILPSIDTIFLRDKTPV